MRTAITLFVLLCVAITAEAQTVTRNVTPSQSDKLFAQADATSPCRDQRYVVLKRKALEQMSDREYEYFLRKDKECTQSMAATPQVATRSRYQQPAPSYATHQSAYQPAPRQGMGSGAVIAISILGAVGALVLLGALAS